MRPPVVLMLALVGWAVPAFAQSSAAFPDVGSASRPAPPPAPRAPTERAAVPRESMALPMVSDGGSSFGSPSAPPPAAAPGFGASWGGAAPSAGFTAAPSYGDPARDGSNGYTVEEGPASSMLVIGGIGVGIPYATGLGIAAVQGFENGSGWLAAPVIGPWLALSGRRDPCAEAKKKQEFDTDVGKCVGEPMVRGMLVLDGVLQAAGAVVMIVGASSTETHLVKKREPSVAAAPVIMGKSGYGMAMAGSF